MSIDGHPVICFHCQLVIPGPNTAADLRDHTDAEHPGEEPTYSAVEAS